MRKVLLWVAAFALAACGAPQLPKSVGLAGYSVPGGAAWMEPKAAGEDLLYVSDQSGPVYVFSYPGGELVGTLTGFLAPGGLCSNKTGDVFVADTLSEAVFEYKHGSKKPFKVIGAFGYPEGCAVDPTTGNIAVTTYQTALPSGPGNVTVYANKKKGKTTTYTDPSFNAFLFCGYDEKGNLYVDGVNSGTTEAQFAVLPQGGASLRDFKLDKSFAYPGGIQWDGGNVAIEDVSTELLYRVTVDGSRGKIVGTAHLGGDHSTLLTQFWIQNGTIVVPYGRLTRSVHRVGLWPYPSGGSPEKILEPRDSVELLGATVSLRR
ncbi:MAG TPA: hypothetical protein VGI19_03170 [Candidatus Cybelea sp.]|jgi:hypothetical protein